MFTDAFTTTQWVAGLAATGVSAHLGMFIHGEWHMNVPSIVWGHTGFFTLLWFLVPGQASHDTGHNAIWALGVASYLAALLSSMIIYRRFFHCLRHFPGPRVASVTKLWHVFQARTARNHLVMQKVHEQYGSMARTGPNEITLFHPASIELLDGSKNTTTKDSWYDMLLPLTSAIFCRDEDDHTQRRKVWNQAMSVKSLNEYKPRLLNAIDSLFKCIDRYGSDPVKVNDVLSWFSFDAMADFAFGEDFGMLKSNQWHPVIERQQKALAFLAPFNDTSWIVRLAFTLVPFTSQIKNWMQVIEFCKERMSRVMQANNHRTVAASWFLDEYHSLKSVRSEERREGLLSGNSITLIVAGSDATRATLISAWYFLCKYPQHAEKILVELSNNDATDSTLLAQLPHLNGVINEALRLLPPQMTGGGRITGPEGLWVDDVWIPSGVKVTAPKWVISRLECAFEKPNEFIPERWYSQPELVLDKRAFGPFSFANRQCAGKILALTEVRLTIAMLLKHYKATFAPGYNTEGLFDTLKDQVTAQPGEFWCTFERRQT